MFKSKYVFETKSTRNSRYVRNSLLFILITTLVYLSLAITLLLTPKNEAEKVELEFYKRSPDIIVVFTGAKGRVPFAIKKAKQYKQSNIFITGVYSKNSVETLLRPYEISGEIDPDFLEIDYEAKNTVENVISTLRHLRINSTNKSVLIISHDYHIPRIKHITSVLKRDDDDFKLFYLPVKTKLNSISSVKVVLKEVYKYLRTIVFLTLWEKDTPLETI